MNMILKNPGLKSQFIITRERSLDRKEQIKMLIEKLNVEGGKVLMISDQPSFKIAQKVGCQFLRI